MNYFGNKRIGYTIALIASNLTLYPMLKDIENAQYLSYQPNYIDIIMAYWIYNIGLGIAVYLYSVSNSYIGFNLPRTREFGAKILKATVTFPFIYFLYYFCSYIIFYNRVHKVNPTNTVLTDNLTYNILVLLFVFICLASLYYISLDISKNNRNKSKSNKQTNEKY